MGLGLAILISRNSTILVSIMGDINSLVRQAIGIIGNSALAKVNETEILSRVDKAAKTLSEDNGQTSKKDLSDLFRTEEADYLSIKEQLANVVDVTNGKTRLRK